MDFGNTDTLNEIGREATRLSVARTSSLRIFRFKGREFLIII